MVMAPTRPASPPTVHPTTTDEPLTVAPIAPTAPPDQAEPDVVGQAIGVIQKHVDKEATRRRQELQPKDLCNAQRAALVKELRSVLR